MLATQFDTHLGKTLRVARLGSGPPLILLHGYPDNLQIWCELAPLLAKHFQVIAFDWPGTGYSDAWSGGATPFDMARRLLVLMDSWNIARATIVGHDMGGQPALALAAKHPERVNRLVVMNSLVIWDARTSWEIDLLRKFGWNRFLLEHFPRAVYCRALQTFLPHSYKLPPEVDQDFWHSFQSQAVRRFVIRMCAAYQGTLKKLAETYPSIRTPSLFLWASQDKHFPPAHACKLASLIVGSEVQEISGAQHWMALYLASEVSVRILRFLQLDCVDRSAKK